MHYMCIQFLILDNTRWKVQGFFSYSNCPCCADAVSMMAKVPKKLAGIAIGVLEREWSPNCVDMAHHT